MNLDAAIAAARAESLERSTGSRVTRDRVLESCARSPRRRVHAVVAAVIASMFGASAFAWYARAPQPPPPRALVIAPADVAAAASEPVVAGERATAAVTVAPSVLEEPAPARTPVDRTETPDAELALYAAAHRLHFRDRDLGAAVAAWNRYLAAAPNGRLAPEARFNRLVALVRLERWDEAARELAVIDTTFRPRDIERLRALIAAQKP